MSGKAKFRFFLMLATAGFFGYVGYLLWRERDPMPPLLAGERAYQEGKDLESAGDWKAAADKMDQAVVLLEHANNRMKGTGHGLPQDQAKDAQGRILYTKALALRDKHYDLAAARGSEDAKLPETRDTVTGQMYRNIYMIPDPKERDDASASMRGAAYVFMPKNYDAQLEALRLTLMSTPLAWDQVEKYSNQILAIKDDSRAKFMLAKFAFEQPQQNNNEPMPYANRSEEGMKTAKRYVEEILRGDQNFPVWRTEYLRAQIYRWFMKVPGAKNNKLYRDELEALDTFLLDPVMGAVARIHRGDGMEKEKMSLWDSEGILNLHTLAAEVALEKYRLKNAEVAGLTQVYEYTLEFCDKKAKANDPAFPRPMLIATLLNLMTSSQVLAVHKPKEWNAGIVMLRPMLKEELKTDRCEPYRVAQFAELLMREAQVRRADKDRAESLRKEAMAWLKDGLKFGKEHSFNNLQLMPFNILAANIVYLNSDKRDELQPFLQALQETRHPKAQATALLIDGAFDEREGRLEKAREKLQEAAEIVGGDENVRANASLANVNMAMGRPKEALVCLTNLQSIYDRHEELSPLEKEWMSQFLRTKHDYYALTVIANLDYARRNVVDFYAKNPTATAVPPSLVQEEERRVVKLLKQELPPTTGAGYTARVAWMEYLIGTRRLEQAKRQWQELNVDFAERIEMLVAKVHLLQLEAIESNSPSRVKALPEAVDREIDEFVTRTNSPIAKLYKALWLAQTKRFDQSLAHLRQLKETQGITPEFRRVLNAVLISYETGGSPLSLVRHMPRDPRIDSNWLDIAKLTSAQAAREAAVGFVRHESVALQRVMDAEQDYANGNYVKASEKFADALDFTRIKSMAQQGLMRSMFALSLRDPEKAIELNDRMVNAHPTEPVVFLCYAYACLCRDNIGEPSDNWDFRKTMGSALDRWEDHIRKRDANANAAMMSLTRAEFWFLANRIDAAIGEAKRARRLDPQNLAAIGTLMSAFIADPAQDPYEGEMANLITELKRISPDSQPTLQLIARAEEFEYTVGKSPVAAAIKAYETLLEKYPQDQTANVRLVELLARSGDYDRALKRIAMWKSTFKDDPQAASAEIRVLARTSNMERARAVAQKYLDDGLVRAAKASDSIKDPDPTIQAERRAKFMEDARGYFEREMALGFYRGGAYAEAESHLTKLAKEQFNATATQELLGEIYLKQKQLAKAEAVYRDLVNRKGNNLKALNNLMALLVESRPDEARNLFREKLKSTTNPAALRPADSLPPELLANIGGIYKKLGRSDLGREMLDFFAPAEARYKNVPRVQLYAGYAHELVGDFNKADSLYDRAMRLAERLNEPERVALLADAREFQDELHKKK